MKNKMKNKIYKHECVMGVTDSDRVSDNGLLIRTNVAGLNGEFEEFIKSVTGNYPYACDSDIYDWYVNIERN